MMLGYLRKISPVQGGWVLFDENGKEWAHGDCVHCTLVAIRREIVIVSIH